MATTFTVKPDYADYRTAIWLVFRRTWFSLRTLRTFAALVVIVFTLNLLYYCYQCGFSEYIAWQSFVEAVGFGIVGVAGLIAICALSVAAQSRKVFEQFGTVNQETEFAFSDIGLTATAETSWSKLEWRHFTDFMVDGRSLVLRRTPAIVLLIPVRQLGAGVADRLVEQIRTGGVKQV